METFSVVGLNHTTAPVEVRESVSPKPAETGRLGAILRSELGLSDVVVVPTCSRFEIYAVLDEPKLARLMDWLSRRAGRDLFGMLYVHRGAAAVQHLFRVAAGLDSWIVGETEILGQVKAAYQAACAQKTAGRASHLAFQRALFVGKKVRNETRIVGGIASMGGGACVLARKIFENLDKKNILIFGAGTMAASTVRHLCSKGISGVWVANRSVDKAQVLAAELGGQAMTLQEGLKRLDDADIAVFSTAAESHLLDGAAARELSRRRGGKPLFIIDLAMPRNVDPEVAKADGVCLYDIDDLRRLVEESLGRRSKDLSNAERIAGDESAACWARLTEAEPAAVLA